MAYKLTDFQDIYTAIQEELKVQATDLVTLNRIKRAINMMYLDEVVPAARWYWLSGNTTLTHPAYYGLGTCAVTPTSTTVTISYAPAATDGASGSFLNYKFSVDNDNEVYKITAHTALAQTMTLDKPYNGTLSAATGFKIWKEDIALPTDCRETIEVWHDHLASPLEPRGLQEFRKLAAGGQKSEGRPAMYTTYDYADPTPDDGETESDRYRLLKLFPSISTSTTFIKVDYVKEVSALDSAGDEPQMPVEDRIVLFYGALSLLWGSIGRNPEEAARNRQLFDTKLAKMAGKIQDSMDKPRIEPDSVYMSKMRGGRIKGVSRRGNALFGAQASTNNPSYLKNVTIEGATITDDLTVNPSVLIDGRDLSVDAALNDAHIAATSGVHGTTGTVVGTSDAQTLTNKTVDVSINTFTNIANSNIAAAAAIARTKLASGTAYRIIANSSNGEMAENAALTSGFLVQADANGQLESSTISVGVNAYLADVEALTSVTLTDNTAVATNVAQWAHASFDFIQVAYSLARGAGNRETGTIYIATDGSTASVALSAASMGTLGTTFTVDISGANVRLRYTTTSTGTNVTMKYKLQKWL